MSIPDLVLVGSGGAAAEIVGYLDDLRRAGTPVGRVAGFLGPSRESYEQHRNRYGYEANYLGHPDTYDYPSCYAYVVAFAQPGPKLELLKRLLPMGLEFPSIIHPTAMLAGSARLGQGNIVGPHCLIGPACRIGDFNLLTAYSFISHDCELGSFNFLSSSGLSGSACLGDANFLGIRATLLPGVCVGSHNVIQAGMIVDKDLGDRETVFYKFKEKIQIIQPEGH
ncbi:MAG: hypothetical protein EKK45_08595 [Curvibacter sp.]|nr:MAG: hypothetical protein EKK45_08595 [Curvibacter sp.]